MNSTPNTHTNQIPKRHAIAGFVAGAMWLVTGALQLTGDDAFTTTVIESDLEHVMLAAFAIAVLVGPLAVLGLARTVGAVREGAVVCASGVALMIASTCSNINGDDFGWFPAVAVPANLAWLVGTVLIARRLKKTGTTPNWIAYSLPFIQVAALPLSRVGGGVLAGAVFFAISFVMLATPGITTRRVATA